MSDFLLSNIHFQSQGYNCIHWTTCLPAQLSADTYATSLQVIVALVVVCCAKSDNFFSSSSLRHPRLLCQHFLLKIRIRTCGIDYNPGIILCLNETGNTLQKYSNSR